MDLLQVLEYGRLVESLPDGSTFAEVGVLYGHSLGSNAYLFVKKGMKVYAVDLFEKVIGTYKYDEGLVTSNPSTVAKLSNNLLGNGIFEIVTIMPQGSVEGAKILKDSGVQFDMVFIDANHDYENVTADIEAWYPLVKPGGIIAGHDYGEPWPDVMKAVNEKFPNAHVMANIWSERK
jgi:hypothetical protein